MAPPLLFDISRIDLDAVCVDAAQIEEINPHRGDMRMLDGVTWISDDGFEAMAFKDLRDDEFWVPGHIPGRPLLPGVLMIEAGAQLASYMTLRLIEGVKFIGFVGCEGVKFRGQTVPGDRLVVLGNSVKFNRRRSIFAIQGLVNSTLVFEARIIGMPI